MRMVVAVTVSMSLGLLAPSAFAHGDCTGDGDCTGGQVCFQEACSTPCEADADCPEDEVCTDGTACQHADGDGHEEGCSAAGSGPGAALPLFGLAILAAAVRLVRTRWLRR
jgi:uncharacterized protein (TIGR03382 family)